MSFGIQSLCLLVLAECMLQCLAACFKSVSRARVPGIHWVQLGRDLYARFYEAFAGMGEPNIPIDQTIMRTDAFRDLLQRLRQHAEEHYRDHWQAPDAPSAVLKCNDSGLACRGGGCMWRQLNCGGACRVQCSICGKWRIITYEVLLAAKDADWSCRQLRHAPLPISVQK